MQSQRLPLPSLSKQPTDANDDVLNMDPAVLPSLLAFRLCNCDYIYPVDSKALIIAVKIYHHLSSAGALALNLQR